MTKLTDFIRLHQTRWSLHSINIAGECVSVCVVCVSASIRIRYLHIKDLRITSQLKTHISNFGAFLGSYDPQLGVCWEFHRITFNVLSLPVERHTVCSSLAGAAGLMIRVSHRHLFRAAHLKTQVPWRLMAPVGVRTL